jgi:hypothetical protein
LAHKSRQKSGFFLLQNYLTDQSVQQQFDTVFKVLILSRALQEVRTCGHSFEGRDFGTFVGVVSVSLVAKCITTVTFVLPEADNKSLLVGFPILVFSLVGCQNSGCAHVFCVCCSLLFSASIYLVMCVSAYDIVECGLLHT